MALTKYTYSISTDTAVGKVATAELQNEIAKDLSITIAVNRIDTSDDVLDIWMKAAISVGEKTTLDSVVASHNGITINIQNPLSIDMKPLVHQTSRKLGTITYFTGSSDLGSYDNSSDISVGGNVPEENKLKFHHTIGMGCGVENSCIRYLDLNIIENETMLHEGYLQWKGALNDELTVESVPKVTSVTTGVTGTLYNLYGGYLIIPAAGDGTIAVASEDLKLVRMPKDEFGVRPQAFWNADWNTTTKVFENITAAGAGDGVYNMFSVEVTLDRFANGIPVLGDGFMNLQTSDAFGFGHNMRLKVSATTYGASGVTDHEWWANAFLTMHRKKTV